MDRSTKPRMDRSTKPRTTAPAPDHIWSSLPDDPVMEIGGRFLVTGDVDYYLDMRAVFRGWRAAMDDPKEHQTDPRFLLQQWVMLDEEHGETNTFGRLFLNTATGRFLRMDLSPLADKYFVVTSTGGLLVLASRSPPHAVLVINPFTASCIKFRAPMPDLPLHTATAHLRVAGTTSTLVLEHPSSDTAYSAKPDDEHFSVLKYNLLDKAHNTWGMADDTLDGLVSSIIAARSWEKNFCCYFLESAGEMLLVLGRSRSMEVFKVNFQQKVIEPVRSIGSCALFLGERCVSVDAQKFSSIKGNCIFYRGGGRDGIYMYDFATEKEELITTDVIELFGFTGKPVAPSIVQLLMNYCTNIPSMVLARE